MNPIEKVKSKLRIDDVMRLFTSSSPTALLICLALTASAAFGQSLSITKKVDNKYWIEVSAPAGNPGTLQASENLHLWVDIQENVQEPYSYALEDAAIATRYFRLVPSAEPAPPIRVMLLGDSMSSDCCGWGQGIYQYFKPNATVINYSQPWTSTKVFLQSAEWEKVQLAQPDYVLIQYGYMEGAYTDPARHTTVEEYINNLHTIIETIRGFNGIPILINLHAARIWTTQGNPIPSEGFYNPLTKQVAVELNTPLIDLYKSTFKLFGELGPSAEAWMHFPGFPADDRMHVSPLGATYVARLVCRDLPDNLGPYLTGIFNPPPPPPQP